MWVHSLRRVLCHWRYMHTCVSWPVDEKLSYSRLDGAWPVWIVCSCSILHQLLVPSNDNTSCLYQCMLRLDQPRTSSLTLTGHRKLALSSLFCKSCNRGMGCSWCTWNPSSGMQSDFQAGVWSACFAPIWLNSRAWFLGSPASCSEAWIVSDTLTM